MFNYYSFETMKNDDLKLNKVAHNESVKPLD